MFQAILAKFGLQIGVLAAILLILGILVGRNRILVARLGAAQAQISERDARIAEQNSAIDALKVKSDADQAEIARLDAQEPKIEKQIVTRIEKVQVPTTCPGAMTWLGQQAPSLSVW